MLSFEEKKSIFLSFHLMEKKISHGRINFIYPESIQKGQVLGSQLHPSGNGYVIGKYMSNEVIENNGFNVDSRGWISIKDFSQEKLLKVISEAIKSMSDKKVEAETKSDHSVTLENVDQENSAKKKNDSCRQLEKLVLSFWNSWFGMAFTMADYSLTVWEKMIQLGNNRI